MEVIDGNVVRSMCAFPNADYVFAPSIGASGCIILLRNSMLWLKLDEFISSFSVPVFVRDLRKGADWVVTCVYGPCSSSNRIAFWA